MDRRNLTQSTIKFILLALLAVILAAIIFFISAGRLDLPHAWVYFIVLLIHYVTSLIFLYRFNPELIVERLKRKKDAKTWDKILMRASNLFGLFVPTIVIGLDIGRYRWSHLGIEFAILGYILFVGSNIILNWAMAVNRHFEPTVRIQKDRDHQVVTNGPYRIVRHPGYFGALLFYFSTPLILGSVYGFIPAAIGAILLIVRTTLEDRTLKEELEGYADYARRTKYRLFPKVW